MADGADHCAFLKADALPLKADALPLKVYTGSPENRKIFWGGAPFPSV